MMWLYEKTEIWGRGGWRNLKLPTAVIKLICIHKHFSFHHVAVQHCKPVQRLVVSSLVSLPAPPFSLFVKFD